ncbi:repressor [Marinitoga sp. 1197]|uniref:LexA family protein n=1 Tax=Marinitoga sp. 1197 TaxID=1428449 RepID=UPI000640CE58|nr:XRE family transcriptional regulator [Marinitoga sp. 1197]AJW76948.1 transcriptional regulator [Marinitoga camini virus 1]KLO23992.1 repressor [Marinitoga sp. 1197]
MLKDRLKKLRQDKGLTQEELAKKLNITRKSISAYETGRATPSPEMLKVIAEFFNVTTDYLLGIDEDKNKFPSNAIPAKFIPVVGKVSAGNGILADENILNYLPVPQNKDVDFGLIVEGDSMEPAYNNGDYALIRKQTSLDNGDIGVFIINGNDGIIKKFYQFDNSIHLVSLNTKYEPIVIPKEEWDEFIIVGKVVGKIVWE